MDNLQEIHQQEVDSYVDQIMTITSAPLTDEAKRALLRDLVEWLV